MKSITLLALAAQSQAVQINTRSDPNFSSIPVEANPSPSLPYGDYFHANYSNFSGTPGYAPQYERAMPEHFQNMHLDDMFMNSMIKNYSKEGKNPDGSPNGRFYVDKDNGYLASQEVVHTHLGLSGEKLKNYLDYHFEEKWNYWDVNGEGIIEADRMSTFFRDLCKDARLNIQ